MSVTKEFKEFAVKGNVIELAVGVINSLKRKEEAAPSAPAALSAEVALLTETRDLLKK